ncbi:MAG: DUF2079 domain-containing protein, partial [Flavobacteriales bacterium]
MSWLKRPFYLYLLAFMIPAVLWALVSFVNHACFRTYALDLGMMNQALYQFSIGEEPMFTQGLGEPMPFLCDHFSPALVLFVPFQWFFGSFGLLVVQWLAALLTGWLLLRWVQGRWGDVRLGIWAHVLWAASFGIWGAISFDMHMNVLLACGMAAMLFLAERRKWVPLGWVMLLMIFSKETGGLIAGCMALALAMDRSLDGLSRKLLGLFGFISICIFLLVLMWWMPSRCGTMQAASHATYAHLGNSWGEIVWSALNHPLEMLRFMIDRQEGGLARTKVVSWMVILLSGGWACWSAPRYLIVFIPLVALRFLSSNALFWDVNAHYSVELSVVLTLWWVHALARLSSLRMRHAFSLIGALLVGFVSWRVVVSRGIQSNPFSRLHYCSKLSLDELHQTMQLINRESVCATSVLCPHIYTCSEVRLFPNSASSKWILLEKKPVDTFPISSEEYLD